MEASNSLVSSLGDLVLLVVFPFSPLSHPSLQFPLQQARRPRLCIVTVFSSVAITTGSLRGLLFPVEKEERDSTSLFGPMGGEDVSTQRKGGLSPTDASMELLYVSVVSGRKSPFKVKAGRHRWPVLTGFWVLWVFLGPPSLSESPE